MRISLKINWIIYLVSLIFLSSSIITQEQEITHPVIKPIPLSSIKSSKKENYSTYKFRITENKKTNTVEKSGVFWELVYQFLDESGKKIKGMSPAEILENYRVAALDKGGKVQSKTGSNLTFSIPREGGGISWVAVQTTSYTYTLRIIDENLTWRIVYQI